jgi:hypothetical protein
VQATLIVINFDGFEHLRFGMFPRDEAFALRPLPSISGNTTDVCEIKGEMVQYYPRRPM